MSEELHSYGGGTLKRDLIAGLTVSALALPSGIAYAELAGVSPVAGLYALLLPSVVYAFLGSSRQLVIGPEGAIAALVATAVLPVATGDPERYASLAALLALMVGAVLVYRLDNRLFFANAGYVRGRIREAIAGAPAPVRWLVFDAEALSHVDATGVHALKELVLPPRRRDHVLVARLKDPMMRAFRDAGLVDVIGERRIYPTVRAALDSADTQHAEA